MTPPQDQTVEDVSALFETLASRCLDDEHDRSCVAVAVAELVEAMVDRRWAECDARDAAHVRAQRTWAIYWLAWVSQWSLADRCYASVEAALRALGYDRARIDRLVAPGPPECPPTTGGDR